MSPARVLCISVSDDRQELTVFFKTIEAFNASLGHPHFLPVDQQRLGILLQSFRQVCAEQSL